MMVAIPRSIKNLDAALLIHLGQKVRKRTLNILDSTCFENITPNVSRKKKFWTVVLVVKMVQSHLVSQVGGALSSNLVHNRNNEWIGQDD